MTFTHALSTNNYGEAKFIVSSSAANGTHTTIATALTSASSGDTIFIRAGSYTENITLKAGVNLVGFSGDEQTPNVTIVGKATFTTAGTVSISNVRFQTNSDFVIAVTGSAASILNLNDCYFDCTNNTGISFTSSSASAVILCENCKGNLGTTLISLFASSSAGTLFLNYCYQFTNTGGSSTASTISAGVLQTTYSVFAFPITTSGTASCAIGNGSFISTTAQNVIALTVGGSGTNTVTLSSLGSGTASAISIGATCTLSDLVISSSNTNVITGAGTVNYAGIVYSSTSSNLNTTTKVINPMGPSVTVGSANTGAVNVLLVTNTSNTATSDALLQASVGGTSAGDAFSTYTVSGTTNWSQGVDNSDSDAFVLAASTALGTTNVMHSSTAGEINYPLQPAFLASDTGGAQANVTGDGTTYTVLFATEVFDQNADYASPTFTAPVTGRYYLAFTVCMVGITAGMTASQSNLVTSNRTYLGTTINAGASASSGTTMLYQLSILADMDAADTATVTVQLSNGTKVADVNASNANTSFCGHLVC